MVPRAGIGVTVDELHCALAMCAPFAPFALVPVAVQKKDDAIAVEFARRVLPHEVRPTFEETEQFCKGQKKQAADAAAAAQAA